MWKVEVWKVEVWRVEMWRVEMWMEVWRVGSVEGGSVESGGVEGGSVEGGSVEDGDVEDGDVEVHIRREHHYFLKYSSRQTFCNRSYVLVCQTTCTSNNPSSMHFLYVIRTTIYTYTYYNSYSITLL